MPVKNNELTTWIGIEAEGDTLIYTIKVEVDSKVLTKQQKELVARKAAVQLVTVTDLFPSFEAVLRRMDLDQGHMHSIYRKK